MIVCSLLAVVAIKFVVEGGKGKKNNNKKAYEQIEHSCISESGIQKYKMISPEFLSILICSAHINTGK